MSTKVLAALSLYKSFVNVCVKPANDSVAVTRQNLSRNWEARDIDRARNTIRTLTKFQLQITSYNKITEDLRVIETNIKSASKKKCKDPTVLASLARLQEAAKLHPSKEMKNALSKFPKAKVSGLVLPHDYSVLLAGADPAASEIAAFLPAIAQKYSIPIDFLEAASGLNATYDTTADPLIFEGSGSNEVFPTVEPTIGGEVFPTVEPRFG